MTPEIVTVQSKRFQCRHIFTDGRRCGSPALRGPHGSESFCYFHHNTRQPAQPATARRRRHSHFALPSPSDLSERSGIQLALGQVLQKIASNDIDPRRAGLLLYGLQIASLNLKKDSKNEEDIEPVSEVTHDPEHGLLAPSAELGANKPKSSLELLIDELDAELDDELDAEPVDPSPAATTSAENPPSQSWPHPPAGHSADTADTAADTPPALQLHAAADAPQSPSPESPARSCPPQPQPSPAPAAVSSPPSSGTTAAAHTPGGSPSAPATPQPSPEPYTAAAHSPHPPAHPHLPLPPECAAYPTPPSRSHSAQAPALPPGVRSLHSPPAQPAALPAQAQPHTAGPGRAAA